ncbi:MAG: AbrB/MazE/SpoVT family DNA-binding domain-containing protein [Bacteroidota bacterium]|nr:AbrB/MazE/SpoVT family DNA-binding domain-containing protein [Bacteroidota bacterium]
MKSTIRNIGNSKGIILPQSFLKECFIEDEVDIEVKENHIIISAPETVKRKGWEQSFKEMAKNGDDQLLIPDVFDDENVTDWKW